MNKRQPIEVPALDGRAIGERLRAARKSYGYTLRDIARVSGLAWQTIGAFEAGTRTPSLGSAVRLSVALRRTLDFLLLGRGARRMALAPNGAGGKK